VSCLPRRLEVLLDATRALNGVVELSESPPKWEQVSHNAQ